MEQLFLALIGDGMDGRIGRSWEAEFSKDSLLAMDNVCLVLLGW